MASRLLFLTVSLAAAVSALPLDEECDSCSDAWAQCGGTGWTGETCCVDGHTCVEQNPYYWQCLPDSQVTSGASTTAPVTKALTTAMASATEVQTTLKSAPTTFDTKTASTAKTSAAGSVSSAAPSSASTGAASSAPAGTVTDAPSGTVTDAPSGTASGTVSYTGNPFSGVQLYPNSYYAAEISSSAIPKMSGALATQAAAAAKVPSFLWLDTASKVPSMGDTLAAIRAANKAGASPAYAGEFVVYDLPDRDCAAAASNGEYKISDGGVDNYKAYIDAIRKLVVAYSDIRIILIIEPDSLANLVTNLNVPKCAGAHNAYLECVNYALTQLNLPNVAMYLDAGHAGWLGWPANLTPAAQLFASVYKNASSPAAVRGLVTNVANYNGWDLATAPSYTQGNANYDEKHYISALAPLLKSEGFPAHFITDTGRNGKQPTGQLAWGDWCNVKGAGIGARPSTETGLEIADAFVWTKPAGESDGTSDTSSKRYDYHCGLSDAMQPAPEAGTWFQDIFVELLTNANPPF